MNVKCGRVTVYREKKGGGKLMTLAAPGLFTSPRACMPAGVGVLSIIYITKFSLKQIFMRKVIKRRDQIY